MRGLSTLFQVAFHCEKFPSVFVAGPIVLLGTLFSGLGSQVDA